MKTVVLLCECTACVPYLLSQYECVLEREGKVLDDGETPFINRFLPACTYCTVKVLREQISLHSFCLFVNVKCQMDEYGAKSQLRRPISM